MQEYKLKIFKSVIHLNSISVCRRMNKIMKKFIATTIFIFAVFVLLSQKNPVDAAFLRFSPTNISAVSGNTFQVGVLVDSGSDEILSTDAYIIFDSKVIQAQSVSDGTYFPYVVHNITPGKVSIRGLVTDAATSRTGSGTLATLTFKVLAPGSAGLSFFCDMNASDTSKIVKNDINASNIIVCTQNNTATVTAVAPTPSTATASGTITPTGGAGNGNGGSNGAGTSGTGSNSSGTTGQGGPGSGGNASIGTGQNVDNNARPTQLPRSGGLDDLKTIGVAGSVLFILGGAASLVL